MTTSNMTLQASMKNNNLFYSYKKKLLMKQEFEHKVSSLFKNRISTLCINIDNINYIPQIINYILTIDGYHYLGNETLITITRSDPKKPFIQFKLIPPTNRWAMVPGFSTKFMNTIYPPSKQRDIHICPNKNTDIIEKLKDITISTHRQYR